MTKIAQRTVVAIVALMGAALLPAAALANNGDTNGHYGSPGR